MNLLLVSTLYPNAIMPEHGVFVENRLRHLIASGRVAATVVAPVPWFPWTGAVFSDYGAFARVPAMEERHGIRIFHPRYPVIPKVGMSVAPVLLYQSACRAIRRLARSGTEFDIIDAHYFYPDGVAAALLGRAFGKPVVITARGTDINVIANRMLPRRMILWAAGRAEAVICVSDALRRRIAGLGADADKLVTLRNGVDLVSFTPAAREATRAKMALTGPVLATVGNLVPTKGQRHVVGCLQAIPGATLLVVGEGPDERAIRELAARLGVAERVRMLGRVAQDKLHDIYSAADVSLRASEREGWPNVLLESLACGTPVVATDVGGVSEIVTSREAGVIVRQRTPEALAAAVHGLFANLPDRDATRAYAERFSWDATTRGQLELFGRILSDEPGYSKGP